MASFVSPLVNSPLENSPLMSSRSFSDDLDLADTLSARGYLLLIPLVLLTGSLLWHGVYRLWFHPLAQFPGPLLGRLTNLNAAYYAWRGDGHLHMQQCHDRYGDFVRYAPNRLLVNTHTGVKAIYSHRSDFQKAQGYKVMVHRAPNTLTHIDKKGHGRKRRLVSQGLSEAAIRSYEPLILERVDKFCDALAPVPGALWSEPHNMAKLTNYLTFDIMSAVVFGEAFNLLGVPENRFVPDCIEASNVRTGVLVQAEKLTFGRIDRYLFKSAIRGRNRFVRFVTQLLQTRTTAKPLIRSDAFSYLLQARDPETGQKLSMAELGAEATTLVVAGSDTTSTAIAGFFFYLSRYPAAAARAAAEVRAAFPEEGDKVGLGAALHSCSYLAACIDEAMRLAPPAATAPWRETLATVQVDGVAIPQGVDVGTCIFALHHHPDYFPDPFEFRPERWLVENRSEKAQAAFMPFSIGPRSCVGKGLAKAELMLTCASILRRFHFECAPGQFSVGGGSPALGPGRHRPEEYQMWDHITCAKNGPVLRFQDRDGIAKQ